MIYASTGINYRNHEAQILAATGLSHGHRAQPEHAARAVSARRCSARRSRARARCCCSSRPSTRPIRSRRCAPRYARAITLQVIGATGAGILTEQEWVLDSPGAAAMVFGEPLRLRRRPAPTRRRQHGAEPVHAAGLQRRLA